MQREHVDAEMPRTVAPAVQATPSALASVDSQIVRCQRVSLATVARDLLPLDSPAIDIGEVDDRRRAASVPISRAGAAAVP